MNILILSDGFSAPAYKPRLRSLCDYLYAQGHVIDVFCEKADLLLFHHEYPIYEVSLYNGRFVDWALKNCANLLFNWKDQTFEREVEQMIGGKTYDLVFCTSFHTFPLQTANRIAKKRNIPSVLDLRDMVEQAPANKLLYLKHHNPLLKPVAQLYSRRNIHRRNRELRKANAVTTISPWHANLIKSITSKPSFLIYNGYDDTVFRPKNTPSQRFKIIYTGKVFPLPQQDPSLLFEAIKKINISPDQLSVEWYTDTAGRQLIQYMAKQAGVLDWMRFHDMVDQNQIPGLLHDASICLVLTSRANDINGHGKMTTKFYEALGVEKPVLCVESDEECLAQVIRQTNVGLSATNSEQVSAFIMEKYAEWQENGYTRQPVVASQKVLFSRQKQAGQWEELFIEITAQPQKPRQDERPPAYRASTPTT